MYKSRGSGGLATMAFPLEHNQVTAEAIRLDATIFLDGGALTKRVGQQDVTYLLMFPCWSGRAKI
jgi:hypothetical protein